MAEVAASAIGIASFGVPGLAFLLDDWRDYKSHFSSTYGSIEELSRTLILLQSSHKRQNLDKERADQVNKCLESCTENLTKLSKSSGKLQEYHRPKGLRQTSWVEVQKIWYPFKKRTLDKLQTNVSTAQQRLNLALQVLQLDVNAGSHDVLTGLQKSTAQLNISVTQIAAQNQRLLDGQYSDEFLKIIKWLSPPDPWINHASARKARDSQTGSWLVQSATFRKWKLGDISNVWLHGKAGCGKTILCYTAIEEMRSRCQSDQNVGLAIFYFSFSDDRKQTLADLLRSFVSQLARKEPALSMLRQMSEGMPDRSPGAEDLEKVLMTSITSYDKVFLFMDALDECPDHHKDREDVLEFFERLTKNAPNIRMFATSRHVDAIGESMKTVKAETICIDTAAVNADIQMYVHNEMSRDRVLRRLNTKTQDLIEYTVAEKADGMFRWADCQLQELKKLKSTKPKYVQEALRSLPATLDETYSRMLRGIGQMYHAEALTLLQWLAYARSPLTLNELVEAAIINPVDEVCIDLDDVGEPEDALNILSGLVITEETESTLAEDPEALANQWANVSSTPGRLKIQADLLDAITAPLVRRSTVKVRIAHFSVKEFLESARIRSGDAAFFHLDPARSHGFLTQCCLAYLLYYSASEKKESSPEDLKIFPLLRYAADSWFYHSALQQSDEVSYELAFLGNEEAVQDWDLVRSPDDLIRRSFAVPLLTVAAIYYASLLGLHNVVDQLMLGESTSDVGQDANATALQAVSTACSPAQGNDAGRFYVCSANGGSIDISGARSYLDEALQAASTSGHERIVASLLKLGANANAKGGEYYSALLAAALHGHKNVNALLLDQGADVSAVDDRCTYIAALLAACALERSDLVKLLLEKGADTNMIGGLHGSALNTACFHGHLDLVEILLDNGADINAPCSAQGSALCTAVQHGQYSVVKSLLEKGADVNFLGDQGTALHIALRLGFEDLTGLLVANGADLNISGPEGSALHIACRKGLSSAIFLLDLGADVNVQGPEGSALCDAAVEGKVDIAKHLLECGADVEAQGPRGSALQLAARYGELKAVELLLEYGAEIDAPGPAGNALSEASYGGCLEVARLLLERGADIEAQEAGDNALQSPARYGRPELVKLLLEYGAGVDGQSHEGSPLYDASSMGHVEVARLLIEHGADLEKQGLGGTALHLASKMAHLEVVELFIRHGADVNGQGPGGSALHAVSRGSRWLRTDHRRRHLLIAKMLFEHGADVNAEGPQGSALQLASANGHEELVDFLLTNGAVIDARGGQRP